METKNQKSQEAKDNKLPVQETPEQVKQETPETPTPTPPVPEFKPREIVFLDGQYGIEGNRISFTPVNGRKLTNKTSKYYQIPFTFWYIKVSLIFILIKCIKLYKYFTFKFYN